MGLQQQKREGFVLLQRRHRTTGGPELAEKPSGSKCRHIHKVGGGGGGGGVGNLMRPSICEQALTFCIITMLIYVPD